MKPDPSRVLERTLQALLVEIAPAVTPSYRQATVTMQAMLLTVVREEIDRAAARRVEENGALRALFAEAAPAVREAGLRERLASAAASADASLPRPGSRRREPGAARAADRAARPRRGARRARGARRRGRDLARARRLDRAAQARDRAVLMLRSAHARQGLAWPRCAGRGFEPGRSAPAPARDPS